MERNRLSNPSCRVGGGLGGGWIGCRGAGGEPSSWGQGGGEGGALIGVGCGETRQDVAQVVAHVYPYATTLMMAATDGAAPGAPMCNRPRSNRFVRSHKPVPSQ